MLEISYKLANRIAEYPELDRCVRDFIANNGHNPNPLYLSDLTVYVRRLNIDEPELFGWDEETTEDFYTWGHNSRYGHVLEPMMAMDLEHHVERIADYLDL